MTDLQDHPFSSNQQKVLAYLPRAASLLSISCSIFMIQRILRDPSRKKKVYHRIILVLSVHTTILSLGTFLGAWPMPKGSLTASYSAMGTGGTCTAQGFILMFEGTTVAPLYLSLSLFSFLAVRNDFNEIFLRKYEFWLHTLIYIIPLALACIAVKQGFINPGNNHCLLATIPRGCINNDSIECLHNYTGIIEYERFCLVYLGATLLVAFSLTVSLYFSARRKERKNESLRGKHKYRENARKSKSRIIATQSGLYFGAFVCSYIIPTIFRRISFRVNFPLYAIGSFMLSFQGVLNLFVYQRLTLSNRSSGDRFNQLEIDPLEKRILLPKSFVEKMLCSGDQLEFSIFDGTNASDVWGDFIEESSQCDDDEK